MLTLTGPSRHGGHAAQMVAPRIAVAAFDLGQVAADTMQPVIIRRELFTAREEGARLLQVAGAQLGVGCRRVRTFTDFGAMPAAFLR